MELSRIELFQELKQDELTELEKITYKKDYKKGEMIFLEGEKGDAVYFIKSGLIRVFKVEEGGREKTLAFLGNGEFFGEMAFFEIHKLRSAFVQAVEKTVLYIIERESFLNLIRDKPPIAFKMIATLSRRLREADNQIRNLTFKTVKDRL
ncbi:MAG: Crp/Fnr family transcriptional regulator, partial [Bacillota bacterium]